MNPGVAPEVPNPPGRGVGQPQPTPRSVKVAYWLLGAFLVLGALCYAGLAWTL